MKNRCALQVDKVTEKTLNFLTKVQSCGASLVEQPYPPEGEWEKGRLIILC